MGGIVEKAYLRIRQDELYRRKLKLKKINIDSITEDITKDCWNYNIQYEIFLKTSNLLIIKLIGTERTILFKYHKKDRVLLRDYREFLNRLDICKVERGIYITTGVFEENINKDEKGIFGKRVKKVDGIKLIKRQLKFNKLSFLEYLPQ